MSSAGSFCLFQLPADLLEYLTLFFKGREAVAVLTTSSGFHGVFKRSVWNEINQKALAVQEPTRSAAFARYGRLVRRVYALFDAHLSLDIAFDWLQLFPNTVKFTSMIKAEFSAHQMQLNLDSIEGFHGLRDLRVVYINSSAPFDLDSLVKVIIERCRDRNKQRLLCVRLDFYDYEVNEPWSVVTTFAESLVPLSLNELRIALPYHPDMPAPRPEQLAALRPYLLAFSRFQPDDTQGQCVAVRNQRLFGSPNTSFPHLEWIHLNLCCSSADTCDYRNISPSNFPRLRMLYVNGNTCENMPVESENSALNKIVLQRWLTVETLSLNGHFLASTLEFVHGSYPKLETINMSIPRGMVDGSGTFKVNDVLALLPNLRDLTLRGQPGIVVDADWSPEAPLDFIVNSKLKMFTVFFSTISPRLVGLTFMFPVLSHLDFSRCKIANTEETVDVLKRVQQSAGSDGCSGSMVTEYRMSIFDDGTNWTTDLVLELVAAMPKLTKFSLGGNGQSILDAVKERYPHIKVSSW
ncbi:hypothetical protein GQ42DRAFT_159810 [Ramicandelaber brevisporus]|nr:hypothetical protein GQ42DRAFT_159810 [Ramicandelaber brevisporus]